MVLLRVVKLTMSEKKTDTDSLWMGSSDLPSIIASAIERGKASRNAQLARRLDADLQLSLSSLDCSNTIKSCIPASLSSRCRQLSEDPPLLLRSSCCFRRAICVWAF